MRVGGFTVAFSNMCFSPDSGAGGEVNGGVCQRWLPPSSNGGLVKDSLSLCQAAVHSRELTSLLKTDQRGK